MYELSVVKVYRNFESTARSYNLRAVEGVDRKMSKSRNAERSNGNDFGGTRVKCSGSCSTKAFRYWQTIITFHEQSRAIYSFPALRFEITRFHHCARGLVVRFHNFPAFITHKIQIRVAREFYRPFSERECTN